MKVHVLGRGAAYENMFARRGFQLVDTPEEADLIQFTGGEDVNPALYGELPHYTTQFNRQRDVEESRVFHQYEGKKVMAGICRGGQFLNVMCGGRLFQDVDGHLGTHMAITENGNPIIVTSTHHQMMIPAPDGEVVLVAHEARKAYFMLGDLECEADLNPVEDVEAVLYEEKQVLCYQPHPEYLEKNHPCQEYYFTLLEDLGVYL